MRCTRSRCAVWRAGFVLWVAAAPAHAQSAANGPVLAAAVAVVALLAGVAGWILGRRNRRKRRRPDTFSGKGRLLDELDNQNMALTQQVRDLNEQLKSVRSEAPSATPPADLAALAEARQRCAELERQVTTAETRSQALADQLEQLQATRPEGTLPPEHAELDDRLSLENPEYNDETMWRG